MAGFYVIWRFTNYREAHSHITHSFKFELECRRLCIKFRRNGKSVRVISRIRRTRPPLCSRYTQTTHPVSYTAVPRRTVPGPRVAFVHLPCLQSSPFKAYLTFFYGVLGYDKLQTSTHGFQSQTDHL